MFVGAAIAHKAAQAVDNRNKVDHYSLCRSTVVVVVVCKRWLVVAHSSFESVMRNIAH